MQKRLLSGIKPTGTIHIGNYLGAIRQWLDLQNKYDSFLFIADLHALNQVHEPEALRQGVIEVAAAYLAVGIDPEKVTVFQQSQVSAHAELAVIFNSITSMGLLERAHAYKDAIAKNKAINVGLFTYPVLMASDILLYKPEIVPVGKDQQQHVEIAIDIAERFNHLFGKVFPIPSVVITEEVATVPGLDGRKMSKSYDNIIGLFEPEESLRKKVMSIVTDSKRPEEPKDTKADTLFALHALFSTKELSDLCKRYQEGGIGYKESKDILFNNLNKFIEPLRQRKEELLSRPEYIREVLHEGSLRAEKVANATLQEVKEHIGLA